MITRGKANAAIQKKTLIKEKSRLNKPVIIPDKRKAPMIGPIKNILYSSTSTKSKEVNSSQEDFRVFKYLLRQKKPVAKITMAGKNELIPRKIKR